MRTFLTVLALITAYTLSGPALAVVDGVDVSAPLTADEQLMADLTVRLLRPTSDGEYESFCTGVIRNTKEILTAGHCFLHDDQGANGEFNLSLTPVVAEVSGAGGVTLRFQLQGGWILRDAKLDLALARIESGELPVTGVTPILNGTCDVDSEFTAAGFGYTEKWQASDKLRFVSLRPFRQPWELDLVIASLGKRLRQTLTGSHENIVLMDENPSTAMSMFSYRSQSRMCRGDSGGPIFCRSRGRVVLAGLTTTVSGITLPSDVDELTKCRMRPHVIGVSHLSIRKLLRIWDLKSAPSTEVMSSVPKNE